MKPIDRIKANIKYTAKTAQEVREQALPDIVDKELLKIIGLIDDRANKGYGYLKSRGFWFICDKNIKELRDRGFIINELNFEGNISYTIIW